MGSRAPRAWWPFALFSLLFGFGLASVVTLAWLDKGRGRSRLDGAREDGLSHQITHASDDDIGIAQMEDQRRALVRLDDPRLESLRTAADLWRRSAGPRRRVINQVCLVPDVPAFLEAIAMWDEQHFFPILIDEPAWTLPFLRAFRPVRVVRYKGGARAPGQASDASNQAARADREAAWMEATLAVVSAWTGPARPDINRLSSGEPPRSLGLTPPGVVLAGPNGPMLAGAVALAAGRFQPLIRLEPDTGLSSNQGLSGPARHFGHVLTLDEAWDFARRVENCVASVVPHYDQLGDDCDFLTLAGDWPYRFNNDTGPDLVRGHCALDDLVGRILRGGPGGSWLLRSRQRWAYTGRLLGDSAASVARAMCALFLEPSSALLWNTYEGGKPWSDYSMSPVVDRLRGIFPERDAIVHRAGKQADLTSWHRAVDPLNRFGLILINSSGGPQQFAIAGGPGRAGDVPAGFPVAVSMIHSFAAADPTDAQTIAGRWLDQGAFVFFGSMNEPYVTAFRRPRLVAELIAANIPLVAALRQNEYEAFGHPWRLVYLGDPLYGIQATRSEESGTRSLAGDRVEASDWQKIAPDYARWTVVEINAISAESDLPSEDARLHWCLDAAIGQLRAKPPGVGPDRRQRVDWRSVLRQIRRDRLDPGLRSVFDDLLIDTLRETGDLLELSARLVQIPATERGRRVWQALESCATARLARLIQDQEPAELFGWTLALWDEVMRIRWPEGSAFPAQFTERIAALAAADAPRRLGPWRNRLRQTGDALAAQPGRFPHAEVITTERARVEAQLGRRG
jgi:hypothetical protein